MKNLKYSLLLSASFLVNVQTCLAMIVEVETVIREFGFNTISYRKGSLKGQLKSSEEGSPLYTEPCNPKKTILQNNQRTEIILTNQDGRVAVEKTTAWPYCIHGQLKIRYGKMGEGTGTGILVGPHHILTAGHNVYNDT